MTITELEALLAAHPDQPMRFVLPNGKSIPDQYHITEVGHVRKDFIDCGGTVRSASACVLQAWVAANDEEHRLLAGKLATILRLAAKILPNGELPVELEYEAPVISQFSISGSKVAPDAIVFQLANKHTDCLAKESCGLEGGSCGTGDSDCCGAEEAAEESCCGESEAKCC
jgi:hypothetical protein